jgi:hypothetical protein
MSKSVRAFIGRPPWKTYHHYGDDFVRRRLYQVGAERTSDALLEAMSQKTTGAARLNSVTPSHQHKSVADRHPRVVVCRRFIS